MSAGGWFRAVAAGWPEMMEVAKLPLSRANAITDLRWHLDQTGNVPGRPALRARWGWTDYAVRTLLQDEAAWHTGDRQRTDSRATADRQPSDSRRLLKRRESAAHRQRTDSGPTADRQPIATRALIQTSDSDDRLQTEETSVPQAHPPAAPPALGPADPDTEPDWDALFEAVPLTYGDDNEAATEANNDGCCASWTAGGMGAETVEARDPESPARRQEVAVGNDRVDEAQRMGPEEHSPEAHHGLQPQHGVLSDEAAEDEGPVDDEAGAACLEAGEPAVEGGAVAPEADAVLVAVDAGVRDDGTPGPGSLLTPRKHGAARPAPVGDVETLWEAWRAHGSVRGEPNDHRRRAMERVLRDYPLADVLEMIDAAHTGSTDNWRWLQGATSRSDRAFLKPENLLVAAKLAARMEDAQDWVKAGRPRHQVEETRAEARAQAVENTLKQRAINAWEKVILPNRGMRQKQFDEMLAGWGDGPKAQEGRRAIAGGLTQVKGLPVIGAANDFTRPRLYRDFVRGFVEALGGTVSEAELREVG